MIRSTRHARHYVGRDSEINIGKSKSYGFTAKDSGPGSSNISGSLKTDDRKRHERIDKEVAEAIEIRTAIRKKKQERLKRKNQRRNKN